MHTHAYGSTIHNNQVVQAVERWIKEIRYVCTRKYYSVMKKCEIMSCREMNGTEDNCTHCFVQEKDLEKPPH
jgi:hypothetical protein